ncbi:MAG: hypothetical protein Q9222_001145 [Ikaeria aurantiellina]
MPSRRKPLQTARAKIARLANDYTSSEASSADNGNSHNREIINRIQKCFDRAHHENANEQEAKAALRLASMIMQRYNITEADCMKYETQEQRQKRGGFSKVDVLPAKDGGYPFIYGWVEWLIGAILNFFDCKTFSTLLDDRLVWTFCGIADNTVGAAIAFEATHNLILDWSVKRKQLQGPNAVSLRNSYCQGVADGLLQASERHKEGVEWKARLTEELAMVARLQEEEVERRLREGLLGAVGLSLGSDRGYDTDTSTDDATSIDDSDLEEEQAEVTDHNAEDGPDNEMLPDFHEQEAGNAVPEVDIAADFDTELQRHLPQHREGKTPNVPSSSPQADRVSSMEGTHSQSDDDLEIAEWQSARQLTQYRQISEDVADKVIKDQGIKLTKRKGSTNRVIKNPDAFEMGQKDSKKINIRIARLEAGKESPDRESMDLSE